MEKYIKTTGIYDKADTLRLRVKYDKGRGYVAEIEPCFVEKNCVSFIYDREYYDYYNTLVCMLVPCGRRSAKKEAEAVQIAEEKTEWLLGQYIEMALNKGGKRIELCAA